MHSMRKRYSKRVMKRWKNGELKAVAEMMVAIVEGDVQAAAELYKYGCRSEESK